jgi:Transposase DDE domain
LYRKSNGAESRLAYLGHLLIENRHGLIANAMATTADGTAEREAGLLMLHAQWQQAPGRRRTVGADKAYDVRAFIDLTREMGTTPHVTQNLARPGGSAIDGRTTRHPGYAMSQHARPRIEPAFGWLKTIAWVRKVKLRGLANVEWLFVFASAAFNLIRLPKLLQPA